jgi:hypothetical protein
MGLNGRTSLTLGVDFNSVSSEMTWQDALINLGFVVI